MPKYVFPLDSFMVEYVFAPFFDHEHSPAIPIEIDESSTAVAARETDWCWTKIVWSGGRANDTTVMCRCFASFDADEHDALIAAVSLPQGVAIQFALMAGDGTVLGGWSKPFSGTGVRQEIVLGIVPLLADIKSPRALARLVRLRPRVFGGIAIRVFSSTSGSGVLTLNWLGLRNSKAYSILKQPKMHFVPDWSPWILEHRAWGEIAPQYGLLFGKDEIRQVRAKKNLPGWKEHFNLLESKARQFLQRNPETDFGEYLPNHDLRFMRVRKTQTRALHWEGMVVAFVGLINNDQRMIDHALRYLMCMIHTQHWADSSEQRIPSSTWNQRSFMEEMTVTSVAVLLDWLGYALTPQARSLAMQALWTRGMAHVQRDLFQYDYMHRMNQGAVFCRAMVLGGLVLEKEWSRAAGIADEAYATMKSVLQTYIQPDGGISEGPGYLCQTLTATLWTTIAYCRARGRDWRAEAKALFGNTEQYLRAIAAGEPGKCIPSGDCRIEWFSGDGIPILAALFAGSAYSDILMTCLRQGWVHELTGTLKGSGGMIGMVYGPDQVAESRYVAASAAWLPETGKFSQVRAVLGHYARLWATTSRYGGSHVHLDHGAIGLEIDAVPLFVDRGMAEYWKADLAHNMRRTYAHNTLTPVLPDGGFADQGSPTEGAPVSFVPIDGSAVLNVPSQDVWQNYMTSYVRTLSEGDTKSTWQVRDEGVQSSPRRVAFHLHSPIEFVVSGVTVDAVVGGIRCTVCFPWASSVTVTKSLPDFAGRDIFRICAMSETLSVFDLVTTILLQPCDAGSESVM